MPPPAAAGAAPPDGPSAPPQIQIFVTAKPLQDEKEGKDGKAEPHKGEAVTVSCRAAYSDAAGPAVRAAALKALGKSNARLVAFWHGEQIDLDSPQGKTVEQAGWHTGFGLSVYELPPVAAADGDDDQGEGSDSDWARVQARVKFWPPVERVLPATGSLVLREVSGDAAIRLVQQQVRKRAGK